MKSLVVFFLMICSFSVLAEDQLNLKLKDLLTPIQDGCSSISTGNGMDSSSTRYSALKCYVNSIKSSIRVLKNTTQDATNIDIQRLSEINVECSEIASARDGEGDKARREALRCYVNQISNILIEI